MLCDYEAEDSITGHDIGFVLHCLSLGSRMFQDIKIDDD
jgi:hypothetical protein